MKKCFTLIIVTIMLSISCCTSVLARNGICGYKGCTRSTVNCENGTVYCDVHAAVHAKKDGYKVCAVGGCYDKATSGNRYCSSHTCHKKGCDSQAMKRSGYCVTHTCMYSGCYDSLYYTEGKYKGYCDKHARQLHGSSNNKSTDNSRVKLNNGKSKKEKYEMPDCDDYDSYEDFMDDWDGCMPDGSDAEDYWENW